MNSNSAVTFREYRFSPDFPFLYMHSTKSGTDPLPFHFHNCLEIAICEEGSMYWNLEGRSFEIQAGQICLVPPFITHYSLFLPDDGHRLCRYLFFNPEELLQPILEDGVPQDFLWYRFFQAPFLLSGQSESEIASILGKIVSEIQTMPDFYQNEIRSLVQYLMILLCRHFRKNRPDSDNAIPGIRSRIFPAISYIDSHYPQEISTEQLANLCSMTQTQLNASFRKAFDKTPLQYLRQVRIRKACSLLDRTEDSTLSIAYASGFSSISSFNRSFQELLGKTPAAFRNERRAIRKKQLHYSPYSSDSSFSASVSDTEPDCHPD